LKQGNSTPSGGAILVEAGALTVATALFQDNDAVQQAPLEGGGAIAALPGMARVAIYNSIFSGNTAANGGAIQVYGDAVIVDSTLVGNVATGIGGSFMSGGNGGAITAAGNGDLVMCDDVLMSNTAGSFGGSIMRVSVDSSAVDRFERANMAMEGGGGVYLQNSVATMRQVSLVYNSGSPVGGLWVQDGQFTGENLTVAENRSFAGLGAGLLFTAPATLAFSTVANNYAQCPTCFAAAVHGAQHVTLVHSVISNNRADAVGSPVSCNSAALAGGGNFQWPSEAQLCASGISVVDPVLERPLQESGPAGDYSVSRPLPGSPVIGAATGCPAVDILGNPRPAPCAAGAVEPAGF
jgi:predicted outer membrane repeat protein